MRSVYAVFLSLLLPCLCSARTWTAQEVPQADFSMTHVLNPDGVLSAAAVDSIDAVLMRLDKHGIQGLVVAVHQVADADSYSFAIELGRRFGVGGEKNWGFVAVLANQDRLTQIVTGTGLEKFLPDVICYRIQERYMDSYLQHSDWDNAMCACVGAIEAYVMGNEEVSEYLNEEDAPDEDALPWLIPLGLVLGGAGALKWQSKKCPKCGKHKVRKQHEEHVPLGTYQYRIITHCMCSHCGHRYTREQIVDTRPGGFGGGRGGSSSGGGFSGYGGGSFGGGGAGRRF